MESASNDLKLGLQTLRLASERELKNCRARVRRIANGLPAFDSVWIDALVDKQYLTPFQAQYFEDKLWHDLQVGPDFVLQDQVHFDRIMPVFVGAHSETGLACFVSRLQFESGNQTAILNRLSKISHKQNSESAVVVQPIEFHLNQEQGTIDVISSALAGESLDSLLIRRGRFPAEVVRAITIEICKSLSLQEQGHLHGDLRLSNILLTTAGKVSLLNPGVLNALMPTVSIHQALPYDAYDGIAPERFEAMPEVTVASEMYSLGCLLWQLLAGRPPHALADPLAKIAAHRQRESKDIRELVPDCPAELAALIRNLTSRRVLDRPKSFQQIVDTFSERNDNSQQRIRQFIQSFESGAPCRKGLEGPQRSSAAIKTVAALCLTLFGIAIFWNRDTIGLPMLSDLAATTTVTNTVTNTETNLVKDNEPISPLDFNAIPSPVIEVHPEMSLTETPEAPKFLPLPNPNADGIIELRQGTPYRISSLQSTRNLTLRGIGGNDATIIIEGSVTEIDAPRLQIENIRLEFHATEQTSTPVLKVIAQELHLTGCQLSAYTTVGTLAEASQAPLIEWRAIEPNEVAAGRLLVSHCVNSASRPLIATKSPISTLLFQNVLQHGIGSLLQVEAGAKAGMLVPVVFTSCTQSSAEPAIQIVLNEKFEVGGKISLQGNNSIFAATPEVPLVGLRGNVLNDFWKSHIEVSAQGLIVNRDAMLFGNRVSNAAWSPLESNNLKIDGLLSGVFRFTNTIPPSAAPTELQIPHLELEELSVRTSSQLPGFDLQSYQAFRKAIYEVVD